LRTFSQLGRYDKFCLVSSCYTSLQQMKKEDVEGIELIRL